MGKVIGNGGEPRLSRSGSVLFFLGFVLAVSFIAWSTPTEANEGGEQALAIMVLNRLPVRGEYAAEFEAAFAKALPNMAQVPGVIQSWVLRPGDPDEGEYIAMTLWESEAHFRAWTQSEAFQRDHQMGVPREAYRGRNTVEIYEVAGTGIEPVQK